MRYSLAIAAVLWAAQATFGQVYRFEAELGSYGGAAIQNCVPGTGCSGTGYVSFQNNSTNSFVQVNAAVPNGLYEMWVGYNSPFGFKGYDFQVNQTSGSGGLDGNGSLFGVDRAGIFDISQSTNTLRINRGWGWYNVDYVELRPFTPPPLLPVSAQLVDPLANVRTQQLMNYMTSQYGSQTLSGQQGQVGSNTAFPTPDYLNKSGGVVPAIRGSDFIDYSPSRIQFGANPNGESERVIQWAKQTGGIVSMMWHWNAPTDLINTPGKEWWRGFYTDATTFDVQAALANPAGPKYQLLLRDIDAIAVQLQKFEDAGVPVLWRPLHEAQGTWFWWGAKGPQAFKDLWHLMYDRLTEHHGLHNLIWEFTSSAAEANHLDWYPGDDVVDMVGLDIYTDPAANMSGQWHDVLAHYNGRKMIALSETGTLPNPAALDTWGIDWSYFAPWTWDFIRDQYITQRGYTEAQLQSLLQALLNDGDIITLGELPLLPWSNAAPIAGDFNRDGAVDAADYVVWRNTMGQSGAGLAADGDFSGQIDDEDYNLWRANFGQMAGNGALIESLNLATVPEPAAQWLVATALFALLIGRPRRKLPVPTDAGQERHASCEQLPYFGTAPNIAKCLPADNNALCILVDPVSMGLAT